MKTETRSEAIAEKLNELIETNYDSEEGYREAADGLDGNSALQTLFHRYAQQRARFAADLEQEVRTYGGEPAERGSFSGSLMRGWLNIKSAVTGGDEKNILAECERSERNSLERYEEVLDEELPEYLKETIRQQHDEIQESLQHVRALKDAKSES